MFVRFCPSKSFQSSITVPKLLMFSTVPQTCQQTVEMSAIFKHYKETRYIELFKLQQGTSIYFHLKCVFQVALCRKCRKWYSSLECYLEALHFSNIEHSSTHFISLNLDLQTAKLFSQSPTQFLFINMSPSAEDFRIVTLSLSDKVKFHCSATLNSLNLNLKN